MVWTKGQMNKCGGRMESLQPLHVCQVPRRAAHEYMTDKACDIRPVQSQTYSYL